MAYCTTEGIVLRRSDYRESDRIITLLTPHRGRVEAAVRGCRKAKSPLLLASELFTLGEYVLYKGKRYESVTSFALREAFYKLREDYLRLAHASLCLSAAEGVAQQEEAAEHLFILLKRTLLRLCDERRDERAVTAAYLLHFSAIEGFKPRLEHCASCARKLAPQEEAFLDAQSGGLLCFNCKRTLPLRFRLSAEQAQWLRQVLRQGIDKTALISPIPLEALIDYVAHHTDRRLPRLPL